MINGKFAIGVDVGGTKIATGLVNNKGKIISSKEVKTAHKDSRALINLINESVKEVISQGSPINIKEIVGIGIGLPAVIDYKIGAVQWSPNVPSLDGVHLKEIIQSLLGIPAILGYDGHMATIGEHWIGAGREIKNMILIAMGTGVGGGIIADGKLIQGANGLAGNFGWMILGKPLMNKKPYLGWLESQISGTAIRNLVESGNYGFSPEEVFLRAEMGDLDAKEIVFGIGHLLGKAISNLVNILNTEMIVLAGGVGVNTKLIESCIKEEIRMHSQPYLGKRVRITIAKLGTNAGMIGSAKLVFDSL